MYDVPDVPTLFCVDLLASQMTNKNLTIPSFLTCSNHLKSPLRLSTHQQRRQCRLQLIAFPIVVVSLLSILS